MEVMLHQLFNAVKSCFDWFEEVVEGSGLGVPFVFSAIGLVVVYRFVLSPLISGSTFVGSDMVKRAVTKRNSNSNSKSK